MSKKTDNPFDMSAMADPAAFLDGVKKMAEQSVALSQENYAKAKAAMDEVQTSVQQNMDAAQDHGAKISMTAIEKLRANTETAFEHMQKLAGVKTVAEALELQTAFLRAQTEKAVADAKEMQALAQSAATEISKPIVEAAQKATK